MQKMPAKIGNTGEITMQSIEGRSPSCTSNRRTLRGLLLVGASTAAICGLPSFALAQTTDAPPPAQPSQVPADQAPPTSAATQATPAEGIESEGQEIVVTGLRASLEQTREIKRNSTGVVDAVSAEDIGKFPDTNLAEALQRIPGVSIERRNGEGARVTVRGFGPQFNLVTLNGRQIATTDVNTVGGDQDVDFQRPTSRSFDFSSLAADGVNRLEVIKTGRAAIPSGGIGATINVVTLRPLDGSKTGLRGSVIAQAALDTSVDGFKPTPELSGVLTWSNEADTFGAAIFGAYQKRKSAAPSATVNDWNITPFSSMPGRDNSGDDPDTPDEDEGAGDTVITNAPSDPNQLVAIPNDSRYHWSESKRETVNGAATAQFKPMETLTFTADGLYARNKISEERSDQTNWFNRPFDHVTFDDDPVVATAVFLDEGDDFLVKDIGFEQQFRASKTTLYSFGLNANWEVTDQLTLNLDGNTSKSKTVPDSDNGATSTLVGFGAPVVDSHSVDFTHAIPEQHWTLNDAARGNGNGVLDIGDLGTQVQRTNTQRQEQRVNQFRADAGWDFGEGARFDIGGTYIDTKMTSARTQTQQQLGDWGINHVGDVAFLAGDLVDQFCMECKFDHYNPTDARINFRGNAVDLYKAFAAAYSMDANPLTPELDDCDSNTPGHQGCAINTTGNDFDRVREKVIAAYAQLSWEGEFGGRKVNVVGGLRWENTKVDSFAQVAQPSMIVWKSDNDFTTIVSDQIVPIKLKGEYNNLLPAIDFRIEPMDGMVARVSYSKTLARPDYGNLFASQSVSGAPNRPTVLDGVATGTSGNPDLDPLISSNIDLSLEYYFGRSNYVSAGFFAKRVKNFVGISQVEQNLFGLRDPSSGAPGTLSGIALQSIQDNNILLSDVTLFTMTALLIQHNGDIAAATAEFQDHYVGGVLDQTFADAVLGAVDVNPTLNDPLMIFAVATPINQEKANIHGFELQGQYFFGDSGFGVSGSLTMVFGDVKFDRGADPTADAFALTGLGDSANLTGMFEKYGISARIAYNWRGKFLARLNRGSNRNPVYYEPFGTLDASISYNINDRISVMFEGANLLSENIRTYARSKRQLYFAQELKPRLWFGVRYGF